MTDNRESSRVKAQERNIILDEATRSRRQRKALEALEKDNFQDDHPSSSYVSDFRLQMNKKFQQKFTVNETNLNDSIGSKEANPNSSAGNLNSSLNLQTQTSLNDSTNLISTESTSGTMAKKRKLKQESKLRFRKNYITLLEEEQQLVNDKKYNYFSICVQPSKLPQRKFCSVCGFPSSYTCIQCGSRYCCHRCLQTHKDTRCLKWTYG